MKRIIIVAVSFIILSCTTLSQSNDQRTEMKAEKLSIACKETNDVATLEIATLSCDMANESDKAIDVVLTDVRFPSDQKIKITSADEMKMLHDRIGENDKAGSNTGLLTSLLAVTAAAATRDTSSSPAIIGGVAAAGRMQDKSSSPQRFYSVDHLLGGPFTLESKNRATKKALFSLAGEAAIPDAAELCFSKPAVECVSVPIIKWSARSRLRNRATL